ncbi:hypothetical protein JW930_02515 [Candidatus Woesearchaeota archaeon]|nr:hypothetical protein [Candidatus Woesearchaeota archaeon]
MTKKEPSYKVVSLLDVNELLSFAKQEVKGLEDEIKEEQRVEEELKEFIKHIEKHSGHKLNYIGHEKRYGKHLVRFLFQDGGFLEVIVEKPLAMNAHFSDEEQAKKFVSGLKKTLEKTLPDHPVKDMFIDSIHIEDGFKDDVLTVDKWSKIHGITIQKTLVVTVVAVFIFVIIELTKAYFVETARDVLHLESFIISIVTAIIIALFIEPIRNKTEHIVGKMIKGK